MGALVDNVKRRKIIAIPNERVRQGSGQEKYSLMFIVRAAAALWYCVRENTESSMGVHLSHIVKGPNNIRINNKERVDISVRFMDNCPCEVALASAHQFHHGTPMELLSKKYGFVTDQALLTQAIG